MQSGINRCKEKRPSLCTTSRHGVILIEIQHTQLILARELLLNGHSAALEEALFLVPHNVCTACDNLVEGFLRGAVAIWALQLEKAQGRCLQVKVGMVKSESESGQDEPAVSIVNSCQMLRSLVYQGDFESAVEALQSWQIEAKEYLAGKSRKRRMKIPRGRETPPFQPLRQH
ncbi:hypothetical protein BDV98DRAFT_635049 [Pterulicium gracile]|uniref:Uncharacterized protein n=1 Tax=Pterulicium gracile TaxID=1884261 RepID=A0A5C3Q6W1_9AGAR|nr:hypothetical protein BDV98DRAFT_635049 [Pterula gracilis]